MNENITIRKASTDDAEDLLKIYAPYVEHTAISFEYEVPSLEEFRGRIANTLKRYPYLVAECDGRGVGCAYAGEFKSRVAYDWAVETTVNVKYDKSNGKGRN
jgi:phosphinothricin acetyltransferase